MAVGLVLAALTACSSAGERPPRTVEITASPFPIVAAQASPTPEPLGSPTPDPSPSPAPGTTDDGDAGEPAPRPPTPTPHAPSDGDRARFVANYDPARSVDVDHVAFDVDRDGVHELVFTSVRTDTNRSRVEIAWWDGFAYAIDSRGDGGAAARVDGLLIRDVNGDGRTELATRQSGAGESLSIWQLDGHALLALAAVGGCADGTHTYGVAGAHFTDDGDGVLEIEATCEADPPGNSPARVDRYEWRDDAYRHRPGGGSGTRD